MKKNTIILLVGIFLVGLVFALAYKNKGQKNTSPTDGKLSVVASFYPLYFFASSIGGDKVVVTNITPSGAEPHDFEPTAQDVAKMENSQLIILNGGGLETWQANIEKNIDSQKTKIVIAGEGLINLQMSEDGKGTSDPHIWLSPILAKQMADRILAGFVLIDPQNENYYQSNADALKNKLDDLDAQYKAGLKNCAKKDIITSHSAFGYLAEAYGLNQLSIAGLSPDAEPSPSQLAETAKFAKENDIKYIFFESLASPKLSSTLANEIGAKTLVLNPLEGLTREEETQGENYLTVMQNNLTNLETALECVN